MSDRVKVKIDLWVSLVLWLSSALFVGIGFFIPLNEMWVYFIFVLPILLMMIWILVGSYYELREELIYIRIGPFFWRIKYENIKSLKLVKNWLSSMALSVHRIEIREHNKSYVRGTTMISPVNREEFLEEFKRRCFNLEK